MTSWKENKLLGTELFAAIYVLFKVKPVVNCILIGMLLVAAENTWLRCWVFVFYPWNLLLHDRVHLSKSVYLAPHTSVWSEDLLTGAILILVIICGEQVCL